MKKLSIESCTRQNVDINKLNFLQKSLNARNDIDRLTDVFALAGNGTRLRILFLLKLGEELCVCDIADILGMTVSAVSHQLRKLRDRGMILQSRRPPTIFYRLAPGMPLKLIEDMLALRD